MTLWNELLSLTGELSASTSLATPSGSSYRPCLALFSFSGLARVAASKTDNSHILNLAHFFFSIASCNLSIIVTQDCTKHSRVQLDAGLLRTILGSFLGHITSPTTYPGPGFQTQGVSNCLSKTLTMHLLNFLASLGGQMLEQTVVVLFPVQHHWMGFSFTRFCGSCGSAPALSTSRFMEFSAVHAGCA
ncbi:hypothetical protein CB1_000705016 [Camelus ferus]|nr:hypothetical protein CB1_000705016 [Camelus ferus]